MPFPLNLWNSEAGLNLFDSVQTGIIIINKDYNIITYNLLAKQIIGKDLDSIIEQKIKCHNLFFQKSTVCEDCPIIDNSKPWPKQKSMTFKRGERDNLFLRVNFSEWNDDIVLTIQDVTHEVSLLRRIDLMRKEQQAKNVLLERKKQTIDEDRRLLEQLLNHLPEAIITVNASFKFQRTNKAAANMLPISSVSKCYELFGNKAPCGNCPAKQGFTFLTNQKTNQSVKDQFLMEIIIKSPFDDGGMLIFQDMTRVVNLASQIKEHRATITRQNEVLSSLAKLGSQMQREPEAKDLIEFFFGLFLPVLNADSSVILIDDVRAGNLWFTANKKIDQEQMNKITIAYLSRDIQSYQSDIIKKEYLPWEKATQKVLIGADGKRVGILILRGEYNREDQESIKLFIEPLGAYLHNRLLLRQLEEKANTDALTGLYNRGYIDQALREENDKLEKYKINYAVVVIDVNRLKMANDLYGHEVGDRLILNVSKLLKNNVRPTDIIARTGGDEFLILLTNTTTYGANFFIKRLETEVFNNITMMVGNEEEPFPVTVSLGAAGTDLYTPENLIKEADRFMYEAKEAYYKTHKRYR